MISRKDMVGTVRTEGDREILLVEFLGEGSTGVVYRIKYMDGQTEAMVVKFYKPQPFLEMSVLHYSFRVHEELYPDHPLLLPPDERLRQLKEEMIARILSPRFEFRVEIYRKIMETAIQGLAMEHSSRYKESQFDEEDLIKEELLLPRLDENLLYRVQELLDEDHIEEEYVSFFEFLASLIERSIGRLKNDDNYFAFSENVLYNLLGLKVEGFISEDELDHIAADSRVLERVSVRRIYDLWRLAAIMYHRASDIIGILYKKKSNSESGESRDFSASQMESEVRSCIEGAVSACKLIDQLAGRAEWENSRLRGLAHYWYGKTVSLLKGNDEAVRRAFEVSLEYLKDVGDLPDRHDVLLDLAGLIYKTEAGMAESYVREARKIEEDLGIVPPA